MCNTPWCFGDCEECETENKMQKELDEYHENLSSGCPLKQECDIITLDTKTDKCKKCGKIINY